MTDFWNAGKIQRNKVRSLAIEASVKKMMQGAAKGSQLQVLLTVLFWLVGGGLTPTMETDTEGSMQAESMRENVRAKSILNGKKRTESKFLPVLLPTMSRLLDLCAIKLKPPV